MFGFGVKNLRGLDFDKPIELKPITILVGRNTSGKSTFLRAFPLIRQSISTRTSSPILWYGDLVDFGDFKGAVFNNDINLPITFIFTLDRVSPRTFYVPGSPYLIPNVQREYYDFEFSISIVKDEDGSRVSAINISERTNNVTYKLTVDLKRRVTSIIIDGVDVTKLMGTHEFFLTNDSLFPELSVRSPRSDPKGSETRIYRSDDLLEAHPIHEALVKAIKPCIDARTKNSKISEIVSQFRKLNVINEMTLLSVAKKSNNQSVIRLFEAIRKGQRKSEYRNIHRLLTLGLMSRLIASAVNLLEVRLRGMLYIGPARARSDRYYRYQDLAVSEIDPDGKNFAMFLNSLSELRMKSFSSWVENLFDYGVEVGRSGGHITISLVHKAKTVNIVDTGYGISQILPVLGQIWWANTRPQSQSRLRSLGPPILAIEQPELHLHPAHQALLADAFVNSLKMKEGGEANRGAHFLVETHSEALINRLGGLIAGKQIPADQVQILVFESDGTRTKVKPAVFDDEGQLSGWPYGFFLPDV